MSTIGATLLRLQELGGRIPRLESPYPLRAPTFGPPCCEAEINELLGDARSRLGEYAEFLGLCRRIDADSVFCGYHLFSPLAIVRRDGSRPRLLHLDLGGGLAEISVLPVGGDGGGNLFMMGTSENPSGVVWKWCHEYPVRFDGMGKEGPTRLAAGFGQFLQRVAEDWEHFVEDDCTWNHMSG